MSDDDNCDDADGDGLHDDDHDDEKYLIQLILVMLLPSF